MSLLARFPHHVDFQLAFAGEVLVAVGALEAGVREVQVEVLYQVRPLLETPLAFGAHVGFVEVLGAFCNIPFEVLCLWHSNFLGSCLPILFGLSFTEALSILLW